MNRSIDYYNTNAQEFFDRTIDIAMDYSTFLTALPKEGVILDAGCGSGRDACHFKSLGYAVIAFDPSEEMVRRSSEIIGQPTLKLTFQQMDFHSQFDGIWANASLLHVPHAKMRSVFEKLHKALKPSGILYASFKHGKEERKADERHFSDMDAETILPYLEGLFEKISCTLREDRRKVGASPMGQWIHILAKKI